MSKVGKCNALRGFTTHPIPFSIPIYNENEWNWCGIKIKYPKIIIFRYLFLNFISASTYDNN